jgi:hypothetical protein
MSQNKVKFADGAHSDAKFAEQLLAPLFAAGKIKEYPGADYYAICYGELCAYKGDPTADEEGELLAVLNVVVPDCAQDPPLDESRLPKAEWHKQ